ncbi:MAG: hypothetical protein KatS3mg121_1483 [Gammaproteobacteria bacterium]|nr:MAG: hypothetical protein KatS3mg121_1483 [Gammaproteobacteria bacterium]
MNSVLDLPRVLLVDDEPAVLDGLRRQLHGLPFALYTANSGTEGLARLQEDGPFAVVVSDMRMPGMDGAAFLAEVRRLAPDTERILLTGHADAEAAIAAVNEGQIFRYLVKPCDRETLESALREAIDRYDRTLATRAMLAKNEYLQMLSMEDPLLGIGNRRALERDLEYMHSIARRYDHPYSVCYFDIDGYLAYVQEHGRRAGERLLELLAGHIAFGVREADRLYRDETDRLVLLLVETAPEQAQILAERLAEGWREDGGDGAPRPSFSAGIGGFRGAQDERNWTAVLTQALASLRAAKVQGKGRTVFLETP